MITTVYGIPNCDTVKKARAWLNEHGLAHRFHDFKKQGVTAGELDQWLSAVGWERLLNRKGITWRLLEPGTRDAVVDAPSAKALMLSQASLIKRPVVQWDTGDITVAFDPAEWSARL